jgi:hypothetical protein
MQRLSEGLFDQAVKEMAADMKEHDFDVKKKPRREHARDILGARIKAIQDMADRFEKLMAEASIPTYDQPLRDGNRRNMLPVLTSYPAVSKDTAKVIVQELFDS